MARALLELVGDASSFLRSMEKAGAAVGAFEADLKGLAVATETSTKATVAASVKRQARLEQEAVAYKQLAAAAAKGSREQVAAANLSARANERVLASGAASRRLSARRLGAVTGAGRAITGGVTLPAAFVGYEAVKSAVDFNQQMLLLQTNAGASAGEMHRMTGEVLKFASSGQAVQAPAELAKGLFHLESLGLRGAAALHTLRIASVAAGMGQGSLEETTSALGGVIVTGIRGAENYDKAMATLIGTAGAGNMRFGDLAGSIGNVAPAAAAAGVSLPELGAAMATMTDRGFTADEAATRLRMTLALIQHPSHAAKKALKDMGVDADSLGAILRKPGGLLKVLEILHGGIDKVGKTRGNRDLLASFGGGKSGLGIQVLVGSLDSQVSSYAAKVGQVNAAAAKAAANTAAYKQSDAFKLKTDLVQAQAALVKLGTSLAPVAVRIITTVDHIAEVFGKLPPVVKKGLGGMVVAFAIGGPLLLGGAKVVKMIQSIRSAMVTLGLVNAASPVEAQLAGIGTSAAAAETKVGLLRTGLLGLRAIGPLGVVVGLTYFVHKYGFKNTVQSGLNPTTSLGGDITPDTYTGKNPHPMGSYAWQDWNKAHGMTGPGGTAAPDALSRVVTGKQHVFKPSAPTTGGGGGGGGGAHLIKNFSLPFRLQLEAARAAITRTQKDDLQAARDTAAYAKRQIDSGHLSHAALLQALGVEGQATNELFSAQTAAAKKAAEAAKKRKAKIDHFAVPLRLQVTEARADAEAAMHPDLQGPTALQKHLALQVKAAAMKAIRSHHLSMQGLIDAWNAVAQANATLAQASKSKGLAGTYYKKSTAALAQGLGLTRDQQILLRQRAAQRDAHRGYAPTGTAALGQPVYIGTVNVHGVNDVDKLVTQIKKKARQTHQRRGTRR